MKVRIVEENCVGCGICESICSEGIEMVRGVAKIKNENAECLEEAAQRCPRNAIVLRDAQENQESKNKTSDYNQENWIGQNSGQGRGTGGSFGGGQGGGRGQGQGRGMGRGFGRGQGRGMGDRNKKWQKNMT